MTAAEEGVLLLCCRLGDPDAHPLTAVQFRNLGQLVRSSGRPGDPLTELDSRELHALGCDAAMTQRILQLLDRQPRLHTYLSKADSMGIRAITMLSPAYPVAILRRRDFSAPPVLFALGDLALLQQPAVAVVGSRKLNPENEAFAKAAGRQAALEQLCLVSGNALGADQTAQQACLDAGGSCVLYVPDRLQDHTPQDRVLWLSETDYDCPFSPARALNRNKLIHMHGSKTLAAQCTHGKGGTWSGCMDNLRHNWSELYVYDDGSQGARALMEQGATGLHKLERISDLHPTQASFF